jgi:microcystin-dependent protein
MVNEDEAQSESGQIVYANEYTDVSITRNGNVWTLDYNNGEYVGTVTSYDNTIVNKLIVSDMNWSSSGTIYIKDIVVKPKKQCIADLIYPIGSIYMSVNNVSPQALFGGSWEQIKDRFLLSSGDTYANGSTGGEATHTLTTNEMPSHTHTQNSHNHTQNAHSHASKYNDYSYVVSETTGATNKRVTAVSSGSTYVDTASTNAFHHYNSTESVTATNNSQTATNQNTGGGQPHNNLPPYLTVYMWKRTA